MGAKWRNLTVEYIVRNGPEISFKPRLTDRQPSNRGGVLPVETRLRASEASAGLAQGRAPDRMRGVMNCCYC
jgi:hypothetical protein